MHRDPIFGTTYRRLWDSNAGFYKHKHLPEPSMPSLRLRLKNLESVGAQRATPSRPDPSAELERAAFRAYQLEMLERRRIPVDERALAAAVETRRQAEHRAAQFAMNAFHLEA